VNRFRPRHAAAIPRDRQRGQSLVEFAMLVPVFLIILLGILEMGFMFDHTMTVSYATREGARSGSAFASGNATTMPCVTSVDVDKHIVAAVQRVLEAPDSQVVVRDVQSIRIYKSNTSGQEVPGLVNVWTYAAGAGPQVDNAPLDFIQSSSAWNACTRDNTWNGVAAPPDSIGVAISYRYTFVTALSAVMGFFGPPGGTGLTITDRSVMALNPTD
jgi:Flp pilus assembly protein TadG